MSDEDEDSKTFEPTEKKISDALEKGQTATSKEVTTLATLVAITAISMTLAAPTAKRMHERLGMLLDQTVTINLKTQADVIELFQLYGQYTAVLIIIPILLLIIFGLAGALVQNQPRIVIDRIQPKLSNISLKNGVKRLFGQKAVIEFFKMTFKVGLSMFCASVVVANFIEALVYSTNTDTAVFLGMVGKEISLILLVLVGAMCCFAAIDWLITRHEWIKNLKMSHKEVKDEQKQAEGDPMVKARMLSVGRDRSRRRMMDAVPTATFIVTNPTHYAVALRYEPSTDKAPIVVAKGQDLLALKIREIAELHAVPIHEAPPLARGLHKSVNVDQEIPEEFFEAIAAIILFIQRKKAVH